MGFDYGGYINQQKLIDVIKGKGSINPIAKKLGLRSEIERTLEIRERQQFVNRYVWKNLPAGLDGRMMERILYYRGRIVIFVHNDRAYALPFALNGNIDVYGRYQTVTPLTFNGSVAYNEEGQSELVDDVWLPDLMLNVAYDENFLEGKQAVILNDYTQGISEYVIPRYQLNKIYHEELSNIVVLIRHNLISSARVYTMRVMNEDQAKAVYDELSNMENDILENGKRVFAVTSQTALDELLKDKSLETQNYWECYVSLDNLRENTIGIENNGIFKKKERQLKGEMELEASSADLVYADGFENRLSAANLLNKMYGWNITVEESPAISGIQKDTGEEEMVDGNNE